MKQIGDDAVTEVRTPQGDVQHILDVSVDKEVNSSVNSPGVSGKVGAHGGQHSLSWRPVVHESIM